MGEQQNEQTNEEVNLGHSTRTDVGGVVGTQSDTTEDHTAVAEPRQVTPGDANVSPQTQTQPSATNSNAGNPIGDDAPKLSVLQNQLCPNCHTGVLAVTRYDPYALHEQMQDVALQLGKESGGAYDVLCLNCSFRESRAFNPGRLFGR